MKKHFLFCFILALAVSLLYGKTAFYELTYLDDNVWVLDYSWLLQDLSRIPYYFTHPDFISGLFYRPLLNISFVLNASWGGTSPQLYHATNIIFHSVNAAFVYLLIILLGYNRNAAFLFSLLFAVHPALTQAVAWIPGRTDSLLGTFVIASIIFYIKYLEGRKPLFLLFHLFMFTAALLTKETAVVLPVICFGYSCLRKGKTAIFSQKWNLCLWFILVAAWGFFRSRILIAESVSPVTIIRSVVENSPALISYLGKTILPLNLSVLPVIEDLPLTYGVISIILLSLGYVFSKGKRIAYVVWGIGWFLLFLLPSLILSFLKHEYRLYLPIIGIIIVLLELTDSSKANWPFKSPVSFFLMVTIVLSSFVTFRYSENYKDKWGFWNNAVKNSPHSPLAHRNLGAMYFLAGKIDEAEEEYRNSIALNPLEKMVHNNLGLIHFQRGEWALAEAEYKKELLVNPDYDTVHFNLGLLYYHKKNYAEAERFWKRTIELNPNHIDAYKSLAVLNIQRGKMEKAQTYLDKLKEKGLNFPSIK